MIAAVFRDWLPVVCRQGRKAALYFIAVFLFGVHCPIFIGYCSAAEDETTITSDSLEYLSGTGEYVAKGSVRIEQEATTAEADEMIYQVETGDLYAEGNVRYDDLTTSISARKVELNMDRKTGRLFDAAILFKEDNYHLSGKEIERKGENEFYSNDRAYFTTCNGLPPAWCFRGREVDLVVGDRLKAKDASFRIRDVPLLYSPYLFAPVLTERSTGLLMPFVSNSSSRGFGLNLPFYWAISENRDATFVLDMYTKRGIGKGVEYRFVEQGGIRSDWWLYHIRDRELDKDFTEFRVLHDNRTYDGAGWFLNINHVNEKDFYREFNPHKEKQIQRFLESTGELSLPVGHARLYLLAQYWVDLKENTGDMPQKLPEIGYVIPYTRLGSFLVSADMSAVNLWRKNGLSAQRFDLYPRVLHSLGSNVVLSQVIAVRGTAYAFYQEENSESNTLRTGFEYDGNIHARIYRKYDSVTHIIEPKIRYHFISSSENSIPLFDSVELFKKTSLLEFSVMNRIKVGKRDMVLLRVTQPVDTYGGDRPLRPLEFELAVRAPLPLGLSVTYDVNAGKIMTVSSAIAVPFPKGSVTFAHRYNRAGDITEYKAGIDVRPVKGVQMGVNAWYDASADVLTSLSVNLAYASQCWGIRLQASKKPGDFTVMIMFDLFGITAPYPKR